MDEKKKIAKKFWMRFLIIKGILLLIIVGLLVLLLLRFKGLAG